MIKAENINIFFTSKDGEKTDNLFTSDIDFTLSEKEIVLLYGPSGSGKTTIFQMLSHLMEPSYGKITWNNEILTDTNKSNKIRFLHISMIYSVFNFIETISTKNNIMLPSLFAKEKNIDSRLEELITLFDFGEESNINLKDLLKKNIGNLSNGQKEIVSISRALLMENPKFIFADEMLRSFNEDLEQEVWNKVLRYLSDHNKSLFMITHKTHLGKNLVTSVQNNCSSEYRSRILTIEKQKLIEKSEV